MPKKTVEQVLTRDYALKEGMGPDGKKWGVTKDANGWGLYVLGRVIEDRKDDQGMPLVDPSDKPAELVGFFTSAHRAEDALSAYLRTFWDMNDRTVQRAPINEHQAKMAEII